MGQPFPNEVVGGGGALVIPQIRSPDFSESGKTGWAIMANGNAYFFNITAEGNITVDTIEVSGSGTGVFVYSGTPGLGNPPIAALTAGTADPFGNTVQPTVSSVNGGQQAWLDGGILSFLAAAGQFAAGQVYELTSGQLVLQSGQKTDTDTPATIAVFSEQANGSQTEIALEANTVTTTGSFNSTNGSTFDGTQILNGEIILGSKASPPPGYPFSGTPTAAELNNIVNILIDIGLVSS
jgi:hypothetical protein